MRKIFVCVFCLFLSSCGLFDDKKPAKKEKEIVIQPLEKPNGKFIKGTIYNIRPYKNGFIYSISASDRKIHNGYSAQTGFDKGDLVYVQITNGEITYLSLIIKDHTQPDIIRQKGDRNIKSSISTPVEEKINFR